MIYHNPALARGMFLPLMFTGALAQYLLVADVKIPYGNIFVALLAAK